MLEYLSFFVISFISQIAKLLIYGLLLPEQRINLHKTRFSIDFTADDATSFAGFQS